MVAPRHRREHAPSRPPPSSARRARATFSSAPIAETWTSARAVGRGRQRHRLGADGLHRVEALAPALEQDADQVDHHVGVARGRLDRGGIAQVGLHGVDLADPAERLQVAGELGPAHRDADAVAALGERAHHMAAEEARAAEHGDQGVEGDVRSLSSTSAAGRRIQDRFDVLYRGRLSPV